ncbi:MAG: cytochrome bc complex cytochrome b subunit [Planctomycetes bacterium]|nr:cytochrome bc complex cytochrome b subunit [Planctomycetota bacterium]
MQTLAAWFDARLGWSSLRAFGRAHLGTPSGAGPETGWSPALALATALLLALQLAAGALLLVYYKPTTDRAFESLEHLVTRVPAGGLIRNLHVWGAHLLVLLAALHLARAFVLAAYKRPGELAWLAGLAVLAALLALCFTGCVLPWNQLAYWATTIGTEMAGAVPGFGPSLLRLIRGGAVVGEPTLGRFFAVHVLLLPAAAGLALALQVYAILRLRCASPVEASSASVPVHAVATATPVSREWLRGALAANLLLGLLAALAVLAPFELGEKADPLVTPTGVRPEWFFLPVYQGMKFLPERVGGLPSRNLEPFLALLPALGLAALPFLDRRPARSARERRLALGLGGLALAGALALGGMGALSERTLRCFGRELHFDLRGLPDRFGPAK